MPESDVIVIGSGMSGVHAAQTLLEHGLSVTMVDGGKRPRTNPDETTRENFEDVRRRDEKQERLFLGDDLSGIPVDGLTGGLGGGQVGGNRAYVVEDADKLLPMKLKNALVIQSVAEGGLGAAWGAACALLTPSELQAMGLPKNMDAHYATIIGRIGVSGPEKRLGIDSPLPSDLHAERALQKYARRRAAFDRKNTSVAQPLSAILTKDKGERKASDLADMDYWADPKKSVYRPQYTLAELKKHPSFRYEADWIAENIEQGSEKTVHAVSMDGKHRTRWSAKAVMLAAGAVNSARIVLKSLDLLDTPVPFVGKPHVFSACLDIGTIGKAGPKRRISLCQLLVTDNRERDGMAAGVAQLYAYRSLLLFRLLESFPLPVPLAMKLLSLWTPSLVIADIRFPGTEDGGTLTLRNDGVHIEANVSNEAKVDRNRSWKKIRSALRMLGLLPLKNMELPEASSSHYAGTLPMAPKNAAPVTADESGELRELPGVYVADAAALRRLPAKPHSLTLMAHAERVARLLAKKLKT